MGSTPKSLALTHEGCRSEDIMTDEREGMPPLSFEQKLALHQFWTTRIDSKRRELLALMGATSALLVTISLVATHVTIGSPSILYMIMTLSTIFSLFLAAVVAGADFGTLTQEYEVDRSIDDPHIPRSSQTWRRQIMSLGVGMLALFCLCFIAVGAVGDDIKS